MSRGAEWWQVSTECLWGDQDSAKTHVIDYQNTSLPFKTATTPRNKTPNYIYATKVSYYDFQWNVSMRQSEKTSNDFLEHKVSMGRSRSSGLVLWQNQNLWANQTKMLELYHYKLTACIISFKQVVALDTKIWFDSDDINFLLWRAACSKQNNPPTSIL